MTITAKYDSFCPKCRNKIVAGTTVVWSPGTKPVHPVCPAPAAATPPPARIAVEDAGVYILPDGGIAKVKANKEKTRTYALRWHITNGNRLTADGAVVHGDYEYEQGLIQLVASSGRKMTLDEAKAFAVLHGQCCRCGRKLTDAKSVEQGIGPVCIQWFAA